MSVCDLAEKLQVARRVAHMFEGIESKRVK